MKKERLILIVVFFILAIFVSLYFDSEIAQGISSIRDNVFNDFFMKISFVSSEIVIFTFLTVLFLWKKSKRRWILPLWITMGLSIIISFLLKFSVQRPRPFQAGIVPIFLTAVKENYLVWNYSFPSFHAMFVFSVLPLISKEFPKLKYIWIVFISIIAFSRIYIGVHYLSDVLVGGLIGYLIGWFIIKTEEDNKYGEKVYKKIVRE